MTVDGIPYSDPNLFLPKGHYCGHMFSFGYSMAISGTDSLEVPTIYKSYSLGLCKGVYVPSKYGLIWYRIPSLVHIKHHHFMIPMECGNSRPKSMVSFRGCLVWTGDGIMFIIFSIRGRLFGVFCLAKKLEVMPQFDGANLELGS